ncbi:MAG TPA: STAS domain-containing protein [Thermoanaerobaculia bacterium]|nr:STAS domain-containing protein [Thermoanaerobaculia bacterium]
MLEIERTAPDHVALSGRFDASQEAKAREAFDQIADSCTLDLAELAYVSSAGLGLLVALQLRLAKKGGSVTLANASPQVRELLSLAGLDQVFTVL